MGTEGMLVVITVILLVVAVVLLYLLFRQSRQSAGDDISPKIREEFRVNRNESSEEARRLREEITKAQSTGMASIQKTVTNTVTELGKAQQEFLDRIDKSIKALGESNADRIDKVREAVERQLKQIQESNEKKLEQMRVTVDEKLQSTLEKRLGESFKLVSERLEAVQKGLGEMQNLATGVGDLKRVLTNVKARGIWGEYQLGDILEQILSPDQYAKNVQPKPGAGGIVEYAVRLPGKEGESEVWLPIDAKFPQEDYQRLLDAAERADAEAVEKSTAALVRTIRMAAGDISDKYIEPPHTTDFAIMFLPTEGLYAEVIRQPGMLEELQQKYRVTVAGPTNLSAILNSLRMGFRTLAIEKRSSEVWEVLSAVKVEFGKFGNVLAKVKRQLQTASNTIEKTQTRTRAMKRKLQDVEALPSNEAPGLLGLEEGEVLDDDALGDAPEDDAPEDDAQGDDAPESEH